MRLFKGKAEKELDAIIQRLNMNMSNNYKDNAQDDLKELETLIESFRLSGVVKLYVLEKYGVILDELKEKMKGYSHKDQKPYWH